MRTNIITSTALIALLFCLFSANAHGQFIKKLGGAIDKVTQTVDKAKTVSDKVENTRRVVNEWTGQDDDEEPASAEPEAAPQNQPAVNKQTQTERKTPTIAKLAKTPSGNIPANNPLEGYTVKVLECVGNSGTQSVKIIFTVYHELPEQALTIQGDYTKAFSQGMEYRRTKRRVGGSGSVTGAVPTKTQLQCVVEFQNITSDTKTLDKVMIGLRSYNRIGRDNTKKGTLEMNNVAINWN